VCVVGDDLGRIVANIWQFAGRLHGRGRLKTGNGVQTTLALSVMDCPETRFSI
jgi:hypothetical protein